MQDNFAGSGEEEGMRVLWRCWSCGNVGRGVPTRRAFARARRSFLTIFVRSICGPFLVRLVHQNDQVVSFPFCCCSPPIWTFLCLFNFMCIVVDFVTTRICFSMFPSLVFWPKNFVYFQFVGCVGSQHGHQCIISWSFSFSGVPVKKLQLFLFSIWFFCLIPPRQQNDHGFVNVIFQVLNIKYHVFVFFQLCVCLCMEGCAFSQISFCRVCIGVCIGGVRRRGVHAAWGCS